MTSYGRKFDLVVSMMIIHLNPGDDLAIFLEYFNSLKKVLDIGIPINNIYNTKLCYASLECSDWMGNFKGPIRALRTSVA